MKRSKICKYVQIENIKARVESMKKNQYLKR